MSRYRVRVSSGAGPIEVRELVVLVARRLADCVAACELELLSMETRGDAAAARSVDLVIAGDAPHHLGREVGTHALVAASRHRGRRARRRWFAAVTLHREPSSTTVALSRDDLEVRATRSRGPGGQNVNRRATAVVVRHRASGLVVRAQGQRSQWQNRQQALDRLAAKLEGRAAAARESHGAALRATHHRVERGRSVRTYRLNGRGALIEVAGVTERE